MTKILNYKKLNKWSCVPTQLQILSNFKKKLVQSFYTFAYFSFFLRYYFYELYSCQLLMLISSSLSAVKASMKALASRTLVIRGILWSMAPRRMR